MAKSVESHKKLYHTLRIGKYGTPDFELYIRNDNTFLSPFHDIPLLADEKNNIFNMVVEIPRSGQDKLEISRNHLLNPLKHDIKNGQVRVVKVPYPHNYGAIPQTWERPSCLDKHTNLKGDNDPIDVVEIGDEVKEIGSVVQVKVLGIFALIDEDETDWKVIALDVKDKRSPRINNLSDVEKEMPCALQKLKDWFKHYKSPIVNTIGLNEEIKDKDFAISVIMNTHDHWKDLILTDKIPSTEIVRDNVSIDGSPWKKSLESILNTFDANHKKTFYSSLCGSGSAQPTK